MGTKRLNKNGQKCFYMETVLHIQVLGKLFYRARPMGAAQNTVFGRKQSGGLVWWITAFKAEDQ